MNQHSQREREQAKMLLSNKAVSILKSNLNENAKNYNLESKF